MKHTTTYSLVLRLLLFLLPLPAFAVPVIHVKTEPARSSSFDENVALEVSVAEPTSAAELGEAEEWVEKDLEAVRAQNPNARVEITAAEPGTGGEPLVTEVPAGELKTTLRTKLKRWLFENGRVSFTLIRGVANTGVVTWGLMLAPHITIPAALAVGIVAGAMSAGLMYFNKNYQDWLLKSKSALGKTTRFTLTNVVYMAFTKFTAAVAGIAPEHTLLAAGQNILTTSVLGTFAQGTWSLGIAIQSKLAAEKAKARGALTEDKTVNIEVGNNVATLSVSMLSTALSVAKMAGVPFVDIGMVAMGAAGSVYYGINLMRERKWENRKLGEAVGVMQCQETLTP